MSPNLITLDLLNDKTLGPSRTKSQDQELAIHLLEGEARQNPEEKEQSLNQGIITELRLCAAEAIKPLHHLMLTVSLLISVGATHVVAQFTLADASLLDALKSLEYYIFCFALGINSARFAVSFFISSARSVWREIEHAKNSNRPLR